ncbi:MAG TPA: hypothetical protein VKF61_06470 [Candidatus Polarisedimenticolia bacterium]|nr:hypothetical protein [Candidatus Polarisedimenticolia bacterium]
MAGTRAGALKGRETRRRMQEARAQRSLMLVEANRQGGRTFASGLNVNLQRIEEEYVPALKTPALRADLYQRMGNDAKIAAQLRASILPLISAVRWSVEGGDEEARDLVAANLLRQGERALWCETSWTQRLLEMLSCLQYGYAIFGKTREIVDGRMIFRRLTYLHPRTLRGILGPWEFDPSGSDLVAIHRTYDLPNGKPVTDERLPVEDLFFVTWWMMGDNWEGLPIIRAMYRAYTEKDLLAKIQLIDALNRGVGIPKAKLGPSDGKTDRDALLQIVSDLRQGDKSRAFIVEGHDQEIGFLTSQGGVTDTEALFASRNAEIATAAGTDFMQSGQTDSGSRATASVQMVSYMQQLDAIVRWLEDQINHGAGYMPGLVEELVDANFDDVEEYPRLVGSRVSPTEQLDNVPNIVDAVNRGAILHDLTVENHNRKALGLESLTQQQFDDLKTQQSSQDRGGRPDSPTPLDVEEPRDDEMGRAFGLAEKKTPGASRPRKSRPSYPWLASMRS